MTDQVASGPLAHPHLQPGPSVHAGSRHPGGTEWPHHRSRPDFGTAAHDLVSLTSRFRTGDGSSARGARSTG